jgi:hypothetical protein
MMPAKVGLGPRPAFQRLSAAAGSPGPDALYVAVPRQAVTAQGLPARPPGDVRCPAMQCHKRARRLLLMPSLVDRFQAFSLACSRCTSYPYRVGAY